MPVLSPNDPRLGPKRDFESPFSSKDVAQSALFDALLTEVEALPGAPPEGIMAARQAEAWARANASLMRTRFTSPPAGGLRTDWIPGVLSMIPIDGHQEVHGLFSNVVFPRSTDSKAMKDAAIDTGLAIAQNVISAVPVVGNILSAAIGFGRMIWKLLSGKREEQALQVPWEEFSDRLDTDVVRGPLATMMGATDWTPFFAPALAYEAGFNIHETKMGGETRAYGVFSPSGDPDFAGGFGFMPGTERMTQVMQVAAIWKGPTSRRDAITDVGSFLPSSAQFGTGAWSQVNKGGNPDMYKVRAGELVDVWDAYFKAFFGDAFARWDSVSELSRLFMAKALSKCIFKRKGPGFPANPIELELFGQPFINRSIFNPDAFEDPYQPGATYHSIDNLYIRPALLALKQRQKSMLARSVVCALVRYREVGGMPPFAAFSDASAPLSPGYSTFGEELTDYCKEMRELLLTHPARMELAHPDPSSVRFEKYAADVRDVDPVYAAKLEATFHSGLPLTAATKRGLTLEPLEPDAAKPDGVPPPGGGPPFPPPEGEATRRALRWLLPTLAGSAVAAGVGGAVYLSRRES